MISSYTIRKRARALMKLDFKAALKLSAFIIICYILQVGLNYGDKNTNPALLVNLSGEHYFAGVISYAGGTVTSALLSAVVVGIFTLGTTWGFIEWQRTRETPSQPYAQSVRFWHGDTIRDTVVVLGVRFILTFLWTLLLIVPGIIKNYSYSQAALIYAEDVKNGRQIASATEYLTESREMMQGHKLELFVLDLTFIGWWILVGLTFGLLSIYVLPYYTAARAEFFISLQKNTNPAEQVVDVEVLQPKTNKDDEL